MFSKRDQRLLVIASLFLTAQVQAADVDFYGHTVLRYENDNNHELLQSRERLRLKARLGAKVAFTDAIDFNLRFSTGVREKQNSSSITIKRFNEQSMPNNGFYPDQLDLTFKFDKTKVNIGKIPWQSMQATDYFWDTDLNPIGVNVKHTLSNGNIIQGAVLKPLDGGTDTVGNMQLIQYIHHFEWQNIRWQVAPWLVNYSGQAGAEFAKKDTDLDHRSVQLAVKGKIDNIQIGMDLGHTLNHPSDTSADADQRDAMAFTFGYGKLKKPGDWLFQTRLFRIERFSVIREFGQSSVARFNTTNFKGIDFRVRTLVADNWWVGSRLIFSESLSGTEEKGTRFRFETQYSF